MWTRRSFLGALTAVLAAPRSLFARQPLTTLGLSIVDTWSRREMTVLHAERFITWQALCSEASVEFTPNFDITPAILGERNQPE